MFSLALVYPGKGLYSLTALAFVQILKERIGDKVVL